MVRGSLHTLRNTPTSCGSLLSVALRNYLHASNMQDALDIKSDTTIDMTGQVTTPVSSRSEGPGRMTNPLAMGATNPQPPVIGANSTNTVALPPLHSLGEPSTGSNPGNWLWMQLESHQLN